MIETFCVKSVSDFRRVFVEQLSKLCRIFVELSNFVGSLSDTSNIRICRIFVESLDSSQLLNFVRSLGSTLYLLTSWDHLNGHGVMGPFPLDSCRNCGQKLSVDVQIAWMRYHFMGEVPFYRCLLGWGTTCLVLKVLTGFGSSHVIIPISSNPTQIALTSAPRQAQSASKPNPIQSKPNPIGLCATLGWVST